MSLISNEIYSIIKNLFPHNVLVKEYYVKYKGTRLFFDFFIKDLKILIEVQGEQHTRFVQHFHGDKEGFVKSKWRDNLKIEYAQEHGIAFVRFYYNEKITKKVVMKKLYKAIEESYNEQYNNTSGKRLYKKR